MSSLVLLLLDEIRPRTSCPVTTVRSYVGLKAVTAAVLVGQARVTVTSTFGRALSTATLSARLATAE